MSSDWGFECRLREAERRSDRIDLALRRNDRALAAVREGLRDLSAAPVARIGNRIILNITCWSETGKFAGALVTVTFGPTDPVTGAYTGPSYTATTGADGKAYLSLNVVDEGFQFVVAAGTGFTGAQVGDSLNGFRGVLSWDFLVFSTATVMTATDSVLGAFSLPAKMSSPADQAQYNYGATSWEGTSTLNFPGCGGCAAAPGVTIQTGPLVNFFGRQLDGTYSLFDFFGQFAADTHGCPMTSASFSGGSIAWNALQSFQIQPFQAIYTNPTVFQGGGGLPKIYCGGAPTMTITYP